MIVVLKDVADYEFSSGLDELVFSTDSGSARFCLTMGGETILDETYVPDSSGRIIVRDLQQLVEPCLQTNLIESFGYTITADTSTVSRSFTVQYCAAESSLPAQNFMEQYFLSSLMGVKVTSIGRKEFLHLVTTQACSVSAVCTYWADGALVMSTKSVKEVSSLNQVVTVEVSPSLFEEVGMQLLQYVIHAGDRAQTYKVDDECLDVAPALLFTNSFGCQETFYCTGSHELEPQFERSSSVISGMFRNYHIKENRVFSANTGILNTPMSMWADELFRSREIYLLEGNLPGKEITITESDSKRSNDYESMFCYTFKYRYAQRNHNILHLPKAGRVFDFTFDNTFE